MRSRALRIRAGGGARVSNFEWTDGLVVPVTLELHESRWELGAFRFATAQRAPAWECVSPSATAAGR